MTPAKIAETLERAMTLHRQGDLDAADKLYKRILLTRPGHADALHLSGVVALQTGRAERGVQLIRKAAAIQPGHAPTHSNLAGGLRQLGELEAALAACDRALALQPDFLDALTKRAEILRDLGRGPEALEAARGLVERLPEEAAAHGLLGSVLMDLGRAAEALPAIDRALALAPDDAALLNERGNALAALRRAREALAAYDRVIALEPGLAQVHNNRGNALVLLNRPGEALPAYARAAELAPADPQPLLNRAAALALLDRREEALTSFERAEALAPGDPTVLWNKSLLLLQLGRLVDGFALYEARKRTREPAGSAFADRPAWLGDGDIAGKTLLLHAEQGLGDTLQFCRYTPLARARGAKVVLRVQPPLKRLLQGLDPAIAVIGEDEAVPDFDIHCPLLSLPLAFGTDLTSIPADIPYLTPEPQLVAAWRDRLGPGARRIGLAWRGAPGHRNDHNRSLSLEALAPLFALSGEWISLQRDLTPEEADRLASLGVRAMGDELADFADTAALVASLDLVISVDTSLAHLAGALGAPVWVFLPANPDWRWLFGRADSPWYPSARLFRQRSLGDWTVPMAEVAQALAQDTIAST
ncbi:tetratricopeptide repeat protein [Phenylobacterium soli]|uniref:Sulfotransferase n=1 Tax=Phenylobacterium soli TaxID=2170551 RepID=A0A328ALA6_9CAUL|nr:tetratricopeptide repeat protein [Phenylobacterium soli]RAK54796.1 sulfotransferase [Phenylobacterium soli]